MPITRLVLKRFTAFDKLDLKFSPGINVLIGENGTGKTHIMKAAYAACEVSKSRKNFADKLVLVFLPSGQNMGRLAKRNRGGGNSSLEVYRGDLRLRVSFTSQTKRFEKAEISGADAWSDNPVNCVFIPAKEMLSNAPGFLSEYSEGRLNFEEVYQDLILRAKKRPSKAGIKGDRRKLLERIQETIAGKVIEKEQRDEFFLRSDQGEDLEFTLLAEGMKKLALIWLLIQNDSLAHGSILFWDEPEANLNPKMYRQVIQILRELRRLGVQIFLATHDWGILKELDIAKEDEDQVMFHALYRKEGATKEGEIDCNSTDNFLHLEPNAIEEAFVDLNDREIMRDWEA